MGTLQRIKEFIDYKGISIKALEEQIGFSNGAFGSQLRNNKTIGVDKIENILLCYPDLSSEWLLTGNGSMLKNDVDRPVSIKTNDLNEGIPLITIDRISDFGTIAAQKPYYKCKRYVIPAFREAEFLIQIKGNSMYPKYSSGDLVACKKLPLEDIFFQWNKVYVLDTIQGALIKRVKQGSASDHILIISENDKYDPFELAMDQINSIAIVIGVIRLE